MLIRFLNYSGAPKMLVWVAEAMYKLGHEVVVCTYDNKQNDFCMPKGIKWIDLTSERKTFIGIIYKIRKILREYNPDVSISFLLDANVFNILACKGLKTKSVVCERNDPYKPKYYKLKFLKPLFRMADGAVFQLPKVREYYDNIKKNTAIIPNPLVSKISIRCEPYYNRKHIIVTHGRLNISQKRHDLLINAFSKIVKDYPDYQLHIYGRQPPETNDGEILRAQIKELGLNQNIFLMGASMQPCEAIKNAMVWVSTSDYEGMPNALIEAMSIGMPCVATDCSPGGAAFLINDKINGLLVKRGDANAVYEGIKFMIEHPYEADIMGHNALELEKVLDKSAIEKKWEKYLMSL